MIDAIKKLLKLSIFKTIWNNRGHFKYFGEKIYFPKNSIIFQRAVSEGVYEAGNLNIICKLTNTNTTIMDIGANIGIMATPCLINLPNVNVISFEPSPNSFPYLQKTWAKHSQKNRWTLINKAVAELPGTVNFQLASPENAAYESILDTKRVAFTNTVEVECTTIDIEWEKAGKPEVSFVKIDIEGADLFALKGGLACINNCKPYILMEWNKTNILPFKLSGKDLLDFAMQINYKIIAMPRQVRCEQIDDIELSSCFTEDFLLVPKLS
jgi:FkbM family methyltransferase